MIKANPEKPGANQSEKPAEPKMAEPSKSEARSADVTAGSAAPHARQKLAEEAEDFCVDLERFFRRAFGEIPKSTELGELRAQQASVRDLVRRAAALGGETGEQVAALSSERDKFKEAATRTRADFLNYQARTQKDLQRAEELALRGYVSDLLPVLDHFDLALKDASGEKANVTTVKEAMEMISKALRNVLTVRGLERIPTENKPFDPQIHEAVVKRPADSAKGEKPNMVVEEFRAGYLWHGLLLRPAQVLVTEPDKSAAAPSK